MSELFSLVPVHGFPRFVFDAVWQGSVIGLIMLIALRFFASGPAQRSWLAVVGCVLCVVTPCLTAGARSAGVGMLPTAPVVAESIVVDQPVAPGVGVHDAAVPSVEDINSELQTDGFVTGKTDESLAESGDGNQSSAPEPSDVVLHSLEKNRRELFRWREIWLLALFVWATVAIGFLLQLGRSAVALMRICREATECDDALLVRCSQKAAGLLRLSATPLVFISERTSCPAAISWLRPKLIVPPIDQVRSEDHWVGVFAHELAHVQRRDGWSRLITELAIVAMPWQPLVWLLRFEYQKSSEEACDDWAVFAGSDPFDYASSLADWIPRQQPALALGIAGWPRLVRQRIERLLEDRAPTKPELGMLCRVGTVAAALMLILVVSLAQQGTLYSAVAESPENSVINDRDGVELPSGLQPAVKAPFVEVLGDGRLCHWNTARVLGFAADSQTVISTSKDRSLIRWNIETGEPHGKRTLPPAARGKWWDWPVEIRSRFSTDEVVTPDGKSFVQSMANGEIRVVDISRGTFRTLQHVVSRPTKMSISGDGNTVAVLRVASSEQNDIDLIDLPTGRLIHTVTRRFNHPEDQVKPDRWRGMALSADGRRLATGRWEQVAVYDTSNGQEVWSVRAKPTDPKTGVAGTLSFSADGTKLALGGRVRNAETGEPISSIPVLPQIETAVTRSIVDHVAFDPSGRLLALINGSSIRVWDIVAQRQLWFTNSRSGASFSSVRFQPPGDLLATSCGNEIILLDAATGKRSGISKSADRVESIASSPVDSRLLLGLTSGQIEAVDAESAASIGRWTAHKLPVARLAFSSDGLAAASATGEQIVIHEPQQSRTRHVVKLTTRPSSIRVSPRGRGMPIAFSADGSQLFSFPSQPSQQRDKLNRWSTESGKPLKQLRVSEMVLWNYGLTSTPDDQLLVLARNSPQALSVFNAKTGENSGQLDRVLPKRGGRMQVAGSRDGKKIACGVSADAIRVHNRTQENYADLMKGHRSGPLRAIAFHPNGRVLASAAEDGRVVLWDTDTREKLETIKVGPHGGAIMDIAWTHDGHSFATHNANGTVSIYPVTDAMLLSESNLQTGAPAQSPEPGG